jgi:hypothetical protein
MERGHNCGLSKSAWNQGETSRERRDVSTLRAAECLYQFACEGTRTAAARTIGGHLWPLPGGCSVLGVLTSTTP